MNRFAAFSLLTLLLLEVIKANDVQVVFEAIQPATWAKPEKHLFILSGQSNMRALDHDVSFRPALVKEFGEDKIIIVKDALGGQPIRRWYRQWKSSQGDFPENNGDLYDRLMTGVQEAVGDQHILSVTFVWMQGERDAREKNGDVYATSLRGLIDQLQSDLGREDMNFVIGRINDFAMDQPDWIMVREAQVEIAESNPRGAWVDTDDLNDGPDKQGRELINDLHMTPAGYTILGQRFAEKSIELIRKVH